MPQENKNSEPEKRERGTALAGPSMGLTDARPVDDDEAFRLSHCPACGRRFGKRPLMTLASWFTFGTPKPSDVVHYACRDVRAPIAVRREYLRQRRLEAWQATAERREIKAARRRRTQPKADRAAPVNVGNVVAVEGDVTNEAITTTPGGATPGRVGSFPAI